jgi:putative FmdB family regulatory protein
MPIYEFYCRECNTIYKFFSKRIDTTTTPQCPSCITATLERKVSAFAMLSGDRADAGDDDMPIDEAKMERAMSALANEAEQMNEDNPREAAKLMRKLTKETGIQLGGGMEEALRRLERGEDPQRIEEEMGDALEKDEPFLFENKSGRGAKKDRPRLDDHLYDL